MVKYQKAVNGLLIKGLEVMPKEEKTSIRDNDDNRDSKTNTLYFLSR